MATKKKEVVEQTEQIFNIGDEFRITDEMENGVKYYLNKDAYIVFRSLKSHTYIKGMQKIREDFPDMSNEEIVKEALAKFCIVDIHGVALPDGTMVENTIESKRNMLNWKEKNHIKEPFLLFMMGLTTDMGNFPGAGSQLYKI